jgi:tellurite resistance protein TerC
MLKQLRRVVVAVIGGTVVAIGVAMIVLPGPAVVVIPAGLAILATEFVWARRLLQAARRKLTRHPPTEAPPPAKP